MLKGWECLRSHSLILGTSIITLNIDAAHSCISLGFALNLYSALRASPRPVPFWWPEFLFLRKRHGLFLVFFCFRMTFMVLFMVYLMDVVMDIDVDQQFSQVEIFKITRNFI